MQQRREEFTNSKQQHFREGSNKLSCNEDTFRGVFASCFFRFLRKKGYDLSFELRARMHARSFFHFLAIQCVPLAFSLGSFVWKNNHVVHPSYVISPYARGVPILIHSSQMCGVRCDPLLAFQCLPLEGH